MKKLVSVVFLLVVIMCFDARISLAADGAEVFDLQKGEVVKTLKGSASLQSEVGKWLSSIAEPVGSLDVEPKQGLGIKIELAPPLPVDKPWITGTVTEVVLFIGQSKSYYPTLLLFTKEHGMIAVHMHHDVKRFLKKNHLYHANLNLAYPPAGQ